MAAPEVLVVVAAGPGLGRSVALRFAREGAAVGLVARSVGSTEALAAELRAAGFEIAASTIDVRKTDDDQDNLWAVARKPR